MRLPSWGLLKPSGTMKATWKTWLLLFVLAGIAFGVLMLFVDRIPKRDLTLRTINNTSKVVGRFYREHKRLPVTLNEVETNGVPKDDWGNPIIYTQTSSNSYTLGSYGKTGKPGGDGIGRAFAADDVTTITSTPVAQ